MNESIAVVGFSIGGFVVLVSLFFAGQVSWVGCAIALSYLAYGLCLGYLLRVRQERVCR